VKLLKRIASLVILTLLFVSILEFNIQLVEASGTIYIRPDGSIDPQSAPIQRNGNIYTLTDNFTSGGDGIVIQRDNMTLDGAGHTLRSQYVHGKGLDLSLRTNVTVERFNILNYIVGLELSNSTNNAAIGNNITNVQSGIYIGDSSNWNNITGNTISQALMEGLSFFSSSNNIVRNNTMINNTKNFYVYGRSIAEFTNDVDTSNTVEGKPIYYWISHSNATVPPNAGYVALINCTNISIQNLTIAKNGHGILLAFTRKSSISKNMLMDNIHAIDIRYSPNNTILGNNITANKDTGIFLEYSSNNTIAENSITSQYFSGIDFYTTSSHNLVTENMIADNKYGITLTDGSSNNTIFHNNFINNTVQVCSILSANEWNNGYPSGGNYWSDYNGTDYYSGPNQNIVGSDDIGDKPYVIDENNTDHYPLMNPIGPQGDVNHDWVVNILDIVAISSIYHCQEGEPNWNPEADLAPPYGIINMLDLVTCVYHYGEKYP